MSRKPNPIGRELLETLRQHIRIRSGLECNSFSHIRLLQEGIRKFTGEILSFQTLSRFFGVIKNGFNPAPDTLQIIAKYLGYNDLQEFQQLNLALDQEENRQSLPAQIIVSIFSHLEPDDPVDNGLLQMIRNVTQILKQRNRLAGDLYLAMSTYRFCRKYFFERFVNIDGLSGEYGEGLKHYLLHAWNKEETLFAHTIYCYHAFLSDNAEMFKKHFHFVREFAREDIAKLHPSLIGRYYACLVFDRALACPLEIASDEEYDQPKILSGFEKLVHGAGYIPGEAHILAGEFGQGWQLLNSHAMTSSSIALQFNEELITEFNILRLFSGYFSGNISMKKARALYSDLGSRLLFGLSYNYFTLYLLILKRELFQEIAHHGDITSQIIELAEKLGFKWFHRLELCLAKFRTAGINGN